MDGGRGRELLVYRVLHVCVCARERTEAGRRIIKEGGEVKKTKSLVPSHRCSNRSARFDQRVELVYVRLRRRLAHVEQHVGLAGEHGWEEVEDDDA